MVDLEKFRELCRKATQEKDLDRLEAIKEQMKILLSNDDLPLRPKGSRGVN